MIFLPQGLHSFFTLSNLYIQRGARTYKPEIKIGFCPEWLSQGKTDEE